MEKDVEYLEKYIAFARLMEKIYKQAGIHPADFDTVDEYVAAVLSVTATSSLSSWKFGEDDGGMGEMVKNELKKRGEM